MNPRGRLGLTLGAVAVAASSLTLLAVRARAAGVPEVEALKNTGYLEGADGAALDGTHSIAVRFWESMEAEDDLCSAEAAAPKITAWQAFTPTLVTSAGTAIAVAKANGRWRRVGDSIEVMATARVGGDVASSEYVTWPLPNGLTAATPADSITVGVAELWNGSLSQACVVGQSTDARFYVDCHGAGGALSRGQIGAAPKFSYLSVAFVVPVQGWTPTTP